MINKKTKMEDLEILLKEIENKNSFSDTINTNVSTAAVGWHIEHALLALNKIIKGMERSDPKDFKPKTSFAKFYVFTLNKIPRGKAKAPSSVKAEGNFSIESNKVLIQDSYSAIKKLNSMEKGHYFEHPYFGHLNLKPAIKFLKIHTKHHLKIIDDILKTEK